MDPHNSPSSQDVLRFWEVSDPNFAFSTLQGLQEVRTEPISLPPLLPESADGIVGLSDPLDHLIFENITDNVPINGDHNVGPTDFQNGSMDHQEEEYNENRNTGYENIMALTVWPPPPVPFSCSCCQVLRNIVHNNGTHTTKLEIHGRVGLIFHAILEIRFYVDELSSVAHQMIDFCNHSMEDVKQFLMQYCQERTQAGFVMMQDPLSTFYTTICAGVSWDDNINTDEFIQPFQTPTGTNQMSQPVEENNDIIQPKSSLAAQRERTGRLKLADLIDYFHLPIEVAAKRLAICPTVLKKICRKHGMRRWPHRKLKSVDRQILKLQLSLNEKDGEEAVAARAEIERLKQERDRQYHHMEKCKFSSKDMGSVQTLLVCVKEVKQDMPEEWDESMPLPGDIIEGVAGDERDEIFMSAKGRSELSSQLAKLNREVDAIWVKIRRGDNTLKLQACVVQERASKLQRRFTIRAISDERHVAVLGDLTLDQCLELQEMSRKVVNVDGRGFNKKEIKYDWRKKVGTYLQDPRSTVISSIIFMPLVGEHNIGSTTARSMVWFSAAVSSGAPLIFVNIQTEQIVTSEKISLTQREMNWYRQQSYNTTIQIVQGIRLWFLPGIEEVSVVLTPRKGEIRFGMNIKRTEEGFIRVFSVIEESAADRAGLEHLREQASETNHIVVISRLDGKSLLPTAVTSTGHIHCCDSADVKNTLASAFERMDDIQLHVMAWPTQATPSPASHAISLATLRPPNDFYSGPTTFERTTSNHGLDPDLAGYLT